VSSQLCGVDKLRAIFVSYRRSDTQGEAGRLFDDLVANFGEQKVFMDVAGIEAGRDFRKAIEESVANCGVLLVLIGPAWVTAKNEAGVRRLEDPVDFVREEVVSALKRDIPVIPVLVRGAEMPRADQLPDSLKDLAYRNCVELTHARWKSDVQLLVEPLRRLLGSSGEVKPAVVSSGSRAAAAAAIRTDPDGRSSRFDPATLQRISRELAVDIGPVADVVVKRAAFACSSTADLCRKIAQEIESPQQRERFLRRVSASVSSDPVRAIAMEMAPASRTEPVPKAEVNLEQSEPAPAVQISRMKSSSWALISVAAILLVVGVVIVGRRILGTERSATPVTAPDSRQPIGQVQPSTEPTHTAGTQPAQPPDESSANPVNGRETTALKRVRLSPEVAQDLLTNKVMPAYPNLARQAHVQGMVVLDVDISEEGGIESVRTVSGHPMLIPAAIDAVQQWRYKPYRLNGSPVPLQTQVTVSFSLSSN
jgi:TonB family protein